LLATEVSGVVNASLQFDAVQLAPSYRLLKGVPGRSYGISIARRLQLPEAVVGRAEERLPSGERDVAILLTDMEAREALLTERERLATIEADKIRARLATVTDRERKVRDRERENEREARREARRYLLEARSEVERAIAEVRAQAASAAVLDEAARAARRSIEDAAAAQGSALDQAESRAQRDRERDRERLRAQAEGDAANQARAGGAVRSVLGAPSAAPSAPSSAGRSAKRSAGPLAVGDAVLVGTLGDKAGRIVALKGTDARVLVGSMTVSVPVTSLVRTAAPPPPAVKVFVLGDAPEPDPVREVDVRGLRIDEVDDRIVQALDAAIRTDMRDLRIIHGKGTGALRARVAEMLKKDTRVASFRLGAWNEGGAGVTVAEFA
jgi:DNA mismatch repair protein MutS2